MAFFFTHPHPHPCTSLLRVLNKTGQFCFLFFFFLFCFLSPPPAEIWVFSFTLTAGFNLPHSQNNTLYPITQSKRKATNWLRLLKLLGNSFAVPICTNLNLGSVWRCLYTSEESSSFSPFQSIWVHTKCSRRESSLPPLAKNSGLSPGQKRLFCGNHPRAGYKSHSHLSMNSANALPCLCE